MNIVEHIFYRNDRCLAFSVVDNVSEIQKDLPTIILYADNGQYVYQPYVFKQVDYVKNIKEVKEGFQFYFVLKHSIYHSDKLDITMELIKNDLNSGHYITFGEIGKDPFA